MPGPKVPKGNLTYVWERVQPNSRAPKIQPHARAGFPPPRGRNAYKPKSRTPKATPLACMGLPGPKGWNAYKPTSRNPKAIPRAVGPPAAQRAARTPKPRNLQATPRTFGPPAAPKKAERAQTKVPGPEGNPTHVWVSRRPQGGTRTNQLPDPKGNPTFVTVRVGLPPPQRAERAQISPETLWQPHVRLGLPGPKGRQTLIAKPRHPCERSPRAAASARRHELARHVV